MVVFHGDESHGRKDRNHLKQTKACGESFERCLFTTSGFLLEERGRKSSTLKTPFVVWRGEGGHLEPN